MIADARKPPTGIVGYDPVASSGECQYDTDAAEKAVAFFHRVLKFIRGPVAGDPFRLEDWQADIVRTLFGWKRPDGTRRYRNAFIEVPRKNGKSTLIAGLAIYVLFCDAEAGAECYCAASDKDQASLVFNAAASMVRQSSLDSRCKILTNTKRIIYGDSFLRAIPANEGGSHGFDSHFIVGDELHAWPSREFYDVLHTSTGARAQPLEIHITTAGHDRHSICYEVYRRACAIRDGLIHDETFLPVIYEAAESDDWKDPATWAKANPNLGISVFYDYIERECQKAKENPSYENTFRRLHLNQWTSQESRWLPMDKWRACPSTELSDGVTYGALDLSAVSDFTAWVLLQKEGNILRSKGHYFLPEEKAEQYARSENLPVAEWVRGGWLTLIPGARIEHSYVHARIKEDAEEHGVQVIGFDPWNMEQLRQTLEGEGFQMIECRQGYASLSGASKELERRVLGGEFDYCNDPVMTWMADNALVKRDENNNIRPVKDQGRKKIDGIVALVIGIHTLSTVEPEGPSIYETPGMLSL